MPANFKTPIIGICLSFFKYLSYGLSVIRHKKRVSINQNIGSRYIIFPSYPSSTNPRSPEKQFEFKIDDYHLLRENKKDNVLKAIDKCKIINHESSTISNRTRHK